MKNTINISIELNNINKARFNIEDSDDKNTIKKRIYESIKSIPITFKAVCTNDVFVNGEPICCAGETHIIHYLFDNIFTDVDDIYSQIAHLSDEDFLDCFKIIECSKSAAQVMTDEGYADMFNEFL